MQRLGSLLLTHSSRTTNLERCSREFLRRRFAGEPRLGARPPFESLPPARALYCGSLSFVRVAAGGGAASCRLLGCVKRKRKIQHAAMLDGASVLVGFEHHLELWRLAAPIEELERVRAGDISIERCYEHPHLAGLHTVAPVAPGEVALACAAPDAVLLLDLASGRVRRTLRMPEALYGAGYPLEPAMDLRAHYIDDERQTTHLNAAHPVDGGRALAVSTLIQGAVGLFDLSSGGYEELTRGFVGCHGARADAAGRIYFVDSPRGELVRLDRRGQAVWRFPVGSSWLHDAVELGESLFAFALADANALEIWNVETGERLVEERFLTWPLEGLFSLARRWPAWCGNSTQALSFRPEEG